MVTNRPGHADRQEQKTEAHGERGRARPARPRQSRRYRRRETENGEAERNQKPAGQAEIGDLLENIPEPLRQAMRAQSLAAASRTNIASHDGDERGKRGGDGRQRRPQHARRRRRRDDAAPSLEIVRGVARRRAQRRARHRPPPSPSRRRLRPIHGAPVDSNTAIVDRLADRDVVARRCAVRGRNASRSPRRAAQRRAPGALRRRRSGSRRRAGNRPRRRRR